MDEVQAWANLALPEESIDTEGLKQIAIRVSATIGRFFQRNPLTQKD